MAAILLSLFGALGSALHTRRDLVLENLALRQQLAVFKRRDPRPRLTHPDRLFWIARSRVWSRWRETMVFVKPETVVGWHRWAFRRFWTWRSRRRLPGRPPTSRKVRDLIKLERILVDGGAVISPSAAPSLSRSPISFVLTTQVDPAQRDRKTAVPQDRFHLHDGSQGAEREVLSAILAVWENVTMSGHGLRNCCLGHLN
jgi:hypothetical protein